MDPEDSHGFSSRVHQRSARRDRGWLDELAEKEETLTGRKSSLGGRGGFTLYSSSDLSPPVSHGWARRVGKSDAASDAVRRNSRCLWDSNAPREPSELNDELRRIRDLPTFSKAPSRWRRRPPIPSRERSLPAWRSRAGRTPRCKLIAPSHACGRHPPRALPPHAARP
eukprot:scaffold311641_cov18-Tisochrysis_lutea.AAC.1